MQNITSSTVLPLLFLLSLLFHFIIIRRHLPRFLLLSSLVTSSIFFLGLVLEYYVSYGCPTSLLFQSITTSTTIDVLQMLNAFEIPHWLMFGNLLFALRNQNESLPHADTDVDIAVLSNDLFAHAKYESLAYRLNIYHYSLTKVDKRNLYQIAPYAHPYGPHVDLWVYATSTHFDSQTQDEITVENLDYTINHVQKMSMDKIIPLRKMTYLNVTTFMPAKAEMISQMEYGSDFMTPRMSRFECVQNVYNGYTFYGHSYLGHKGFFIGGIMMGILGMTWLLQHCGTVTRRAPYSMKKKHELTKKT